MALRPVIIYMTVFWLFLAVLSTLNAVTKPSTFHTVQAAFWWAMVVLYVGLLGTRYRRQETHR